MPSEWALRKVREWNAVAEAVPDWVEEAVATLLDSVVAEERERIAKEVDEEAKQRAELAKQLISLNNCNSFTGATIQEIRADEARDLARCIREGGGR